MNYVVIVHLRSEAIYTRYFRVLVYESASLISVSVSPLPFDSRRSHFARLSTFLSWKSIQFETMQPESRRLQITSVWRPIGAHTHIRIMNSHRSIMSREWTILVSATCSQKCLSINQSRFSDRKKYLKIHTGI